MLRQLAWVFAMLLLAASHAAAQPLTADVVGAVTFNGVGVPGATVIATRGDARTVTTTDPQGAYRLKALSAGTWSVTTALVGFAPATIEITVPPAGPVAPLALTLLPLADISPRPLTTALAAATASATSAAGSAGTATRATTAGSSPAGAASSGPLARAAGAGPAAGPAAARAGGSGAAPAAARVPAAPAPAATGDSGDDAAAADGFLINGSVNNGAASPFAQARAFGNNRPGGRSLYTGGFGLLSSHSALDARPFTFASVRPPKPDYNDVQLIGDVRGPLRLPGVRNDPIVFLNVQYIRDHATTVASGLVPTAAERAGDFSQSVNRLGQPVRLVDPQSGQPFSSNTLPASRIAPQASSLLGYYPLPNASGSAGFNYQVPIVVFTRRQNVQSTLNQVLTNRDSLNATVNFTGVTTDTNNLFAFLDTSRTTTADVQLNWSRRISPFMFLRTRYQGSRSSTATTPFFSGRTNVSGLAGITGNDQDPANWGPPGLSFASGIAGLSTGNYARNVTWTQGGSTELLRNRGRHGLTIGAGARDVRLDVLSQLDPRGSFAFTGAASGSDVADFLLGLPQTSTIAFGNADKRLRQWVGEAYVNDDWRVSASLTLNVGVRWEFESPVSEADGRLVNLDVATGFGAVQPVLASRPNGALTGTEYPQALVRTDASGILPRVGVAWRPVPGSSLVVRAGYGMYRNTNVYQSLALLLAQQPPLSVTATVGTSPAAPLTLANGFLGATTAAYGNFGVDPDFRVGFAENWNASVQRDLPASMTVIATYSGSRGHRLMQQFLPNSFPAGGVNPCPSCPSGFSYLTSTGRSLRNAGQVQVRRRLRNGFTASVQYTLAKAMDDATAFAGATLAGVGMAQNWLDLGAEYSRSPFDQRHQVTAQAQYTTGAGITGGTLVDGVRGRLLKDWTFVGNLTVGSGTPLTPVFLTPVPGTGITGTLRPTLTGASVDAAAEGSYLNPAAYAVPAPGTWGSAGRNSVSGPAQFALNAAVSRTFRMGTRMSADWRLDATNVLNVVTYAGVNALVGSPQFGLPNRANQMRRIQSSLRVRF